MRYQIDTLADVRALLRRVAVEYITPTAEDDDVTFAIKQRLNALPDADKVLFILYAEGCSYRQMGKVFGVSRTMVLNEVRRIKQTIQQSL